MRLTIAFVFSILIAFTISLSPVRGETVFTNVSILPMDGREIVPGQTVVIDGERITRVNASDETEIPLGSQVIDGTGNFLMPGFAEMHGHIPPVSNGDRDVNDTLFLYLSNGVTTVRGMLGSKGQLQLRDDALSGERLSPTLYLAGPSFNGNSINSVKGATRKVAVQVEEGWDLLKIHPGLTRAEYDAMAAKADELEIDFGGHVPEKVGLLRALEAGQRTIDHLDGYIAHLGGDVSKVDDEALRDIAVQTKQAGAGVVPTSALWLSLIGANKIDDMNAYPELKYMSQATLRNWRGRFRERGGEATSIHRENRRRLLKAMQDADVEILFGTDAPQLFSVPGFSIHHEIDEMEAAGLSPMEIIVSGTSAVGEYFKTEDQFGKIAPGMRADLILLSANPLDDLDAIQEPAGVMVRGQWLSRAKLDEGLAAIAARYDH